MPASSLGFHTRTAKRSAHVSENAVVVVTDTVAGVTKLVFAVLRFLFFISCFTVGVWAYAMPSDAVEAITTLDMSQQEDDLSALLNVVAAATNTTPDDSLVGGINDTLVVFVRVFATLLLLAAAGAPARDDWRSRLASLLSILTAFSLFLHVSITDDGDILRPWFVVLYPVVGCGIPTLVIGLEMYELTY
jgi:hypothetical protein